MWMRRGKGFYRILNRASCVRVRKTVNYIHSEVGQGFISW